MTTAPPPTYRRVCVVAGHDHTVLGPDGKIAGLITKAVGYGWCWKFWGHDWTCTGDSLDEAFANVVTEHGEMEGERGE